MKASRANRVLFCDYDGDFHFADELSALGYLVDQIRPNSLRTVALGEHGVYVFSFENKETTSQVLKVCSKLKSANLITPIIILAHVDASPDFMNHQHNANAANAYLIKPTSIAALMDELDSYIDPPALNASLYQIQKSEAANKKEVEELHRAKQGLEAKLQVMENELETMRQNMTEADALKPKLEALLEGQKLKVQTETERLKVQLSEIEAKLMEREARITELERFKQNTEQKVERLNKSHQIAQQKLRQFYQDKIKNLSDTVEEDRSTTDVIIVPQELRESD